MIFVNKKNNICGLCESKVKKMMFKGETDD
jgi:hypothetical protein